MGPATGGVAASGSTDAGVLDAEKDASGLGAPASPARLRDEQARASERHGSASATTESLESTGTLGLAIRASSPESVPSKGAR
jgi:hypothetical protein